MNKILLHLSYAGLLIHELSISAVQFIMFYMFISYPLFLSVSSTDIMWHHNFMSQRITITDPVTTLLCFTSRSIFNKGGLKLDPA
jgi:hypothetical protein